MFLDARSVSADTELDCDLCVVGAGPAGIAIADRLRNTGIKVVLIESGGLNLSLKHQRLFRGDSVGQPYFALDACRFRMFGGSTNRWGGWCRPLEPNDFAKRDWLRWSGWPIAAEDLEPFYTEAAKLFVLPRPEFGLDVWGDELPAPLDIEGTGFDNTLFQYCPETNFGKEYGERIRDAANITTLLNATVTDMRLEPGTNRIVDVRVETLDGANFQVHPGTVVLAAGGIENARLLLACQQDRPAGLGNEHDLVGRFFMEHLHAPAGHLLLAGPELSTDFYRKEYYKSGRIRGVVTPDAATQQRHQLLSCSIAIEPETYAYGTAFIGWPPEAIFPAVRTFQRWPAGPVRKVTERVQRVLEWSWNRSRLTETGSAAAKARERAGASGEDRLRSLYFRTEQAPNPNSRVTLSRRKDALGMPRASLDWQLESIDTDSVARWLEHFAATVEDRQIGRVIPPAGDEWQRKIIGGPHHIGTTRMAASPAEGVVDADCRVHSVDNLYVAGCSVFSTGGYSNPTFTMVTLALRLAEHLEQGVLGKSHG